MNTEIDLNFLFRYGSVFKSIGIADRIFVENKDQSAVVEEILSKFKLK